ncbi:hypothetical protein HDV00_004840 [Rhizophlyctis rosea]|nr:hypothetical protein HDV00_004840 [Rhizophlyctis rosea]
MTPLLSDLWFPPFIKLLSVSAATTTKRNSELPISKIVIFSSLSFKKTDDDEDNYFDDLKKTKDKKANLSIDIYSPKPDNRIASRTGITWQTYDSLVGTETSAFPTIELALVLENGKPYRLGEDIPMKLRLVASKPIKLDTVEIRFTAGSYFIPVDFKVPQISANSDTERILEFQYNPEASATTLVEKLQLLPASIDLQMKYTYRSVKDFGMKKTKTFPVNGFSLEVRNFLGDIAMNPRISDLFNVLIVGQQGGGKSAFINSSCFLRNEKFKEVTLMARGKGHVTRSFKDIKRTEYTTNVPFQFWDSPGINPENYKGDELVMMIRGQMPVGIHWHLFPAAATEHGSNMPTKITFETVWEWAQMNDPDGQFAKGKPADAVLLIIHQQDSQDEDRMEMWSNVIDEIIGQQRKAVVAVTHMDQMLSDTSVRNTIDEMKRGYLAGASPHVYPVMNYTAAGPRSFDRDRKIAAVWLALLHVAEDYQLSRPEHEYEETPVRPPRNVQDFQLGGHPYTGAGTFQPINRNVRQSGYHPPTPQPSTSVYGMTSPQPSRRGMSYGYQPPTPPASRSSGSRSGSPAMSPILGPTRPMATHRHSTVRSQSSMSDPDADLQGQVQAAMGQLISQSVGTPYKFHNWMSRLEDADFCELFLSAYQRFLHTGNLAEMWDAVTNAEWE